MSIEAWHFVDDTLRDGTPIPEDGVELEHDGPLVLCECGLHASRRIIDALRYAPGSVVCRVVVSGNISECKDKLVASKRTILWRMDATEVLRHFARRQALTVADNWDMPELVRQWLETGDKEFQESANLVAQFCRSNPQSAASGATTAAYWATITTTTICDAAFSAAYWASCSSGRSVAISAANEMLTNMIQEAR